MPNLIQAGKRALTVTVVSATIMWSMGIAALAPVGAATLANGDLIKASGPAVYYYMDAKRLPFPSDKVYKSWYVDFSKVKTITDAELAAIPLAGTNMTYRDGTRCVKITTDPKVYCVEPGGVLRWLSSEAVAKDLLGENWSKQIDDVPDVFFTNYTKGADVTASTPTEGSLIKTADSSDIYRVGAGGVKRKIDGFAAFSGNGYQSQYVRTVSSTIANALTAGAPVTGVEAPLTTPKVAAAPAAAEPMGALTASLSGPAAGVVILGQSLATLANVALTGNGKVTSVTLKRTGVSADTTLSNVYLFDGTKRLTDAAAVQTGSLVNFTNADGLFTVTGSATISVKSDLAGTAGETVGVNVTDMKLSSGAVTGLPLTGSLHSVAAATLATTALGAATASGNADPGKDMLVWQSTATVATRDVQLTRLALRQIGSINSTDISNFKLLLDGTEVASQANLDSNGYVTFTLDKKLISGARILRVQADVTGGSGRTVQMSLRGAYDISVTDSQYNANLAATAAGGFPLAAAAWTVNAGTMTVVKATDSPSQNVTIGSSDVPLAKYTFTANGEKIKVETLRVGVITTGGTVTDVTLRGVRIMVNGAQVGSTTAVPAAAAFAAASGTSFTTNFFVNPGTPATVEIRADIFDTTDAGGNVVNDIAAGTVTAVQALFVGGAATSNAVPSVSLGTINVPSQNNVLGNTLTIASGSISATQTANYGAQTIVVPQNAYKLASFNLVGNATEAVNINTFELDFTAGGGATFDASDDLTDLYIKYGDKVTSTKATVTDADNTWSVSFTLAKNETKTLEVYANTGSTVTATDSITTLLTVTGVTVDSAVTVYADTTSTNSTKDAGFTGQVITANTGSITATVDASRPNSALLDDAGNVPTAAFKFDAVNDSYTVTDLRFTLTNATAVRNVNLKDGTTVIATRAANATVNFNGLSIAVAANTPKVLTVELEMGPVGVGMGSTGSSVLTTLTSATTRTSQGTSAAIAYALAGQETYAYKSVPTLTNVVLPTATLVAGSATLAKFTLGTGSTGTVGWAKLLFTVNKNVSGTDTITSPTLWDVTSGATQVAGTAVVTTLGDNQTSGSITFVPNTEQQVTGSKTYELRATVAGTITAGDSITTQIAQPSAFAASVAAYSVHTASGTNINYYDTDASATVSATDVRQTAQAQYTTADVTATATVVGHNAALKISGAYGISGDITLTLPEWTTDNVINGATFTVTGAGSAGTTCTPFTGTDGTGAVTTQVTTFNAIQSVTCTGTNRALNIRSLTVSVDTGAGVSEAGLVIVITKAADYALGSAVAATNSDALLAVTGGVAPAASFVWSDLSASSHGLNTTDWTNGLLVKNLPTDTQNLTK